MEKYEGRIVALSSLVGSHNYGLNDENSDKDFKFFTLPSFDDLYTGHRFHKQTIGEKEDYDVHDIRKLSDLLYKSNVSYMEVLASKEIMLNPCVFDEVSELFSLRDDIFRMNLPHLYDACFGSSIQKEIEVKCDRYTGGTKHLFDEHGFDTKQATHSHRNLKIIVDFADNDFKDFEKILRYYGSDLELLKGIRHGEWTKEEFIEMNSRFREENVTKYKSLYKSFEPNNELKLHIESIVKKMIHKNLDKYNAEVYR